MKGTAYRDAVAAIDKVTDLKHFRPETAHRAVGSVLAYIGARRLNAAVKHETDGSSDRVVLEALAQAEQAAVELDSIPQRVEFGDARADAWADIRANLSAVRVRLEREHDTRAVAKRLQDAMKGSASATG